jgi:threonine aldolase
LAEDHRNAAYLAEGLRALGLVVEPPETNLVFVEIPERRIGALGAHLAKRGIIASIGPRTRLATHLDAPRAKIDVALRAFREFPEALGI